MTIKLRNSGANKFVQNSSKTLRFYGQEILQLDRIKKPGAVFYNNTMYLDKVTLDLSKERFFHLSFSCTLYSQIKVMNVQFHNSLHT